MKKLINIIVVMMLCLNLLSMNVFANSTAISASGPQTVEKGQVVQVKLNLTATDIYALSGKVEYNASQLKLESAEGGHSALTMALNTANNKFAVYHNAGEFLVKNTGCIAVLNFTVLEATAGATISVRFSGIEATDGAKDIAISDAVCSFAIADPEPTVSEPSASEPSESKPTSSKPSESKPTSSKPSESKPTSSKPSESKPTESKPAVSEPTESEPTVSEPTVSEPTESNPVEPSEPSVEDEEKFDWWWIIVIIVSVCCIIYLIILERKKNRR